MRQRGIAVVSSRRFNENRNRQSRAECGTWMTGGSDRTAHENRSKHTTQRVDKPFAPCKVGLKQSVHSLRRATHEKQYPACPIDEQPGGEEQDDRCHGVVSISKLKRHNKADIRCVVPLWPNPAWISRMAAWIRLRRISSPRSTISRKRAWSTVAILGMSSFL